MCAKHKQLDSCSRLLILRLFCLLISFIIFLFVPSKSKLTFYLGNFGLEAKLGFFPTSTDL